MRRLAHLVKGLGALVVLVGVVGAIPWALWHFVGWPLPHHVPSATQVSRALNHQGIPDRTLVDALAVLVWITWGVLVASIAVEIPAALAGKHPPRLPVAGVFQPFTGRLVAAVIVACLALAPRAGHQGVPSASASVANGARPVATLVLKGTVLADATAPAPANATPTPAPSSPPSAAPTAGSPAPALRSYVVQRGDTLWGIAEQQLGDPLEWQAIYQLNEGRPQPGGVTLTDPHWIDPGWTLLLPTPPGATSAPPAASSVPQPPPAPEPSTVPSPTTEPTTTVPGAVRPDHPASPSPTRSVSPKQAEHPTSPVQLPSGSVVAGSFAAGVLSAVALGRLRRRHAYRYHAPEPGRDLRSAPPRPTLAHLAHAMDAETGGGPDDDDDEEVHREHDAGVDAASSPPLDEVPPFDEILTLDDEERWQEPGRLEVGDRQGATVTVAITEFSGAALDGGAVDEVARALLAGALVRAAPGAAEVLLTSELADRLLPGSGQLHRAVRRVASIEEAVRAVEAERIARVRRLDAADVTTATEFRTEHPENPLSLFLVLTDAPPEQSHGRWAALLADVARLDMAVVFLTPTPLATGRLTIDATRTITGAEPTHLAERLGGVRLFGLRGDEAVELLGAVDEANAEGVDEEPPLFDDAAREGEENATGTSVYDSWPQSHIEAAARHAVGGAEQPVMVQVLGHLHIAVAGEPVTTGLRTRARALFVWFLLRPEGASSEEAVEALWPDTPPDRVRRQFWRSFSDLRARLRVPSGDALEVFIKSGEHYRPSVSEIACDLWTFQAALTEATHAEADDEARVALRRAVEVYRADLLLGTDYPWVEPIRQDLHRRALDALLRLAELEDSARRPDAASDLLERAIGIDRYAEEPYRRLMTLQAACGRLDAVSATWQLLQSRLSDLDLDVEDATAGLYRQLMADRAATAASSGGFGGSV